MNNDCSSQNLPVPKSNFEKNPNTNLLLEVKLERQDIVTLKDNLHFSSRSTMEISGITNIHVISIPASQPDNENVHLPGEEYVLFKWQISFCCLETFFLSFWFGALVGVCFFFWLVFFSPIRTATVPRNDNITRYKMYSLKLFKNY